MDISSPFAVVSVIVVIFVVAILFATSTKEDGHSTH
jgi:VIT1/CCC1 family predicted Fe2+/Mn2+ transporter